MRNVTALRSMLAVLALLMLAPATAQVAPANGPQLDIAHRGASAYAPEHTFFAYDLAMRMDVDFLECDLILSKDEVAMCIHDETIDRTSNGSGRVDEYTLAELRTFDYGSWFNESNPTAAKPEYVGAQIVPLEEQLDCYLRYNRFMRFHIETKDSAGGRAEQILYDMLVRKGLVATGDLENGNVQTSTILLQSFDAGSLERMKSLTSTIPTAFLYTAPTGDAAEWHAAGTGPDYIDAFAPNSAAILADTSVVQRYHSNGHDVHTWTVNDEQQMGTLLDLGVDGIFTNNPDLLRQQIDQRGTGTTKEYRNNPEEIPDLCPGIAGRVTSNQGPGDFWEPTGTRGVQLTQPDLGGSPGLVTTGGGGLGAGLLGGLLALGLVRRSAPASASR